MKVFFHISLFLLALCPTGLYAQISGVINVYDKVTAIGCNRVTVETPSKFSVGDTVLIIQMKGAVISEVNATYGNITSINDAGNFEFAEILQITGNDILFKHTLQKTYNAGGYVQLVSVPQYTDVTITGTLTADPWNGNTGGVLVFEASGTVTFNAGIDVSSLGFRGGAINTNQLATCSQNIYGTGTTNGYSAEKGEGISYPTAGKEFGRGKIANGGGSGTSNNAGGGGGSNYGAGGLGGRQSSGCLGGAAGYPGFGGLTLSTYTNRIFLGGGGGAGHQNNSGAAAGAKGGGIVIIKANVIEGNNQSIVAKGQNGPGSGTWPFAFYDSAGGGGAGGSVLLAAVSYPSALSVDVSGGEGGDSYEDLGRNLGPGGGGGGGVLMVTNAAVNGNITLTANGGISGVTVGGGGGCQCNHFAEAGGAGGSAVNTLFPRSTTLFDFAGACNALPVTISHYKATLFNDRVKLEWTTSSEENNDYFIVEKSQDLNHFTNVAIVEGKGNTLDIHSYHAYDYQPEPGVTYYRLSQKDIDGTIAFLGIQKINYSSEKLIVNTYPVPFSEQLVVEINQSMVENEEAEIILINALGQLVYQSFTTESSVGISTAHLSKGIYSLIVTTSEKAESVQVVK